MAFDQRFAMGLIASSGAGGTALYRRNFGESLENLAGPGAYHWMAGNYIKYSAEESSFGRMTADDLPVDSHMMLALCAPRLTFISHGIPEKGDAHWLDHQGSYMAAIAAQGVYRLLGAKEFGRSDDYMKEKMPGVNVELLDGVLAWRQHDGGHTDQPNVEHFIRWANSQFAKQSEDNTRVDGDSTKTSPVVEIPQGFIIGADISWVQAAEDRGVKFSDNGVARDILEILKDHGFNYTRLRMFHDPTKPTPIDRPYSLKGYCDLPHTIEMAKRVKAAGMGLLIDFHYSDSWADPGKQFTPSEWADLSFDELVAEMGRWTAEAIKTMKDAGVQPDMVQIGNEISPGIMTDRGGSTRDWQKLGKLLKAGIAGVEAVDPKILIVLHIDKSGEKEAARWWVDNALAQDVRFDILGLSCYRRWHGPPDGWKATFEDLANRYPQLSFLIVEAAKEVTATSQIMHELPERKGLGTFIWEPTANNNGQALFDRRGAVIPERMQLYDHVAKEYGSR